MRLIVDGCQDQQQHPAVHTGGVTRGSVCGCGCWRQEEEQIFCNYTWNVTIEDDLTSLNISP